MKIQFTEHEGCFEISLTAETMQEAAGLVRFGMNRTNEIRSAGADVYKDGTFGSNVVFGKSKKANSNVPRRK